MLNNYLEQIINLDKVIESERKNISKKVQDMDEETQQMINHLEDRIITQTTKTCQTQYDEAIKQAQIERDNEILAAQKECQKLREHYEKGKERAIDMVLESLLSEN